MSVLTEPENWVDAFFGTPPQWWEALAADNRYWFSSDDPFGGVKAVITYLRNKDVGSEFVGTTDGSGTFSGPLAHGLVTPGSILIRVGEFGEEFGDDSSGVLIGTSGGSGTIDYTTGVTVINSPMYPDAEIVAFYRYEDAIFPPLPTNLNLAYEITELGLAGVEVHVTTFPNGPVTVTPLTTIGSGVIPVVIPNNVGYLRIQINSLGDPRLYNGVIAVGDAAPPADYRIIRWTRARTIDPRVERYKVYRGTGLDGALNLLATVEVNFELMPGYAFQHPDRYTDDTADGETTYRYRVDAICADGRTLTGNIMTSIP